MCAVQYMKLNQRTISQKIQTFSLLLLSICNLEILTLERLIKFHEPYSLEKYLKDKIT